MVVTTTCYHDPRGEDAVRFKLAQQLTTKAVTAGHKVVIIDGSRNTLVSSTLAGCGATMFPELHRGMGPGRRQAFFHASEIAIAGGDRVVFWTEPEKEGIVEFIPKIVTPIMEEQCDIVIPRRSKKSWKSWPEFQRETEQHANKEYNLAFEISESGGLEGLRDPMFGPVAFNPREVANYFICCQPRTVGISVTDTYIQHWAPVIAEAVGGHSVGVVEIDMIYPPEQRTEEEGVLSGEMRAKRINQRDMLVTSYQELSDYFRKKWN